MVYFFEGDVLFGLPLYGFPNDAVGSFTDFFDNFEFTKDVGLDIFVHRDWLFRFSNLAIINLKWAINLIGVICIVLYYYRSGTVSG